MLVSVIFGVSRTPGGPIVIFLEFLLISRGSFWGRYPVKGNFRINIDFGHGYETALQEGSLKRVKLKDASLKRWALHKMSIYCH